MLVRALAAWFGLMLLAIANGTFRQFVLTPRFDDRAAHAISTVMLCALILLVAWVTISWIGVRSRGDAWKVGGLWLLLTVAFEFFAGHYLFGNSWEKLLADYDLARGRIWVAVLIATLIAPVIVFRRR
jgi:hypothetical protein